MEEPELSRGKTYEPSNVLNYIGTPDSTSDRTSLAFSDQGAWFAYSFPDNHEYYGGFSGPFLMTEGNGIWSSRALSQLRLKDSATGLALSWEGFDVSRTSVNSHMKQVFESEELTIDQSLFFDSPHSAFITTYVKNKSNQSLAFDAAWTGDLLSSTLTFVKEDGAIALLSSESEAVGMIQAEGVPRKVLLSDTTYTIQLPSLNLESGDSIGLFLKHRFTFPENSVTQDKSKGQSMSHAARNGLELRKQEKQAQLTKLYNRLDTMWRDTMYLDLLSKTVLTLQNNWRHPAGELENSGLFPSYHYIWFHGFWAWDSWKHSVALAQFNLPLAKEQVRAMYTFQREDGFIPDCLFRDTTIERHNYRNTKPPLSAWAVWNIYKQSQEQEYLEEIYPYLLKQHEWWYINRDHDQDGLCEYGSTDGTLVAAKWESGMDNAVRFDTSRILRNSAVAFSLDQESVDLNAYLFAEKEYLIKMADILGKEQDMRTFTTQADVLKDKIQAQFFNADSGWFYDTDIEGNEFIEVMGCEGWIPLWAGIATAQQADAVIGNMMDSELFNTKVPFQTLSAAHPDFEPDGGYWRGPNWLDQAYFGVIGLKRYGYNEEAQEITRKLIHNAEGLLDKGPSIRENYNPVNGEGLESENFSWSAAHYLLLLINE